MKSESMSDDEADRKRARKEGLQIERSVPGSVNNTMQASTGVSLVFITNDHSGFQFKVYDPFRYQCRVRFIKEVMRP
ncbi:hypothetical protein ZTR_08935 [Talaromyces verruculosus]|nr:hypothetical protein ZTR_08935 [Talaromyces verruculosus]